MNGMPLEELEPYDGDSAPTLDERVEFNRQRIERERAQAHRALDVVFDRRQQRLALEAEVVRRDMNACLQH